MAFHDDLYVSNTPLPLLPGLDGGNEHIGQLRLHLGVQMDLRLLHPHHRVGRAVKSLDQSRQHLGNTKADIGNLHFTRPFMCSH